MKAQIGRLMGDLCPPMLRRQLWQLKMRWVQSRVCAVQSSMVHEQDLQIYSDQSMADALEQWGVGSVWEEIQYLLINCRGKVLDIACGPGGTMRLLEKYSGLEIHGIDISKLFINQGIMRGIDPARLQVGNATSMPYQDRSFDYGYSIGSLEHFTEQGINEMLGECRRVVKSATFHMIPVSRNGKNQGWLRTVQSFHNNSVDWWLEKYQSAYSDVTVLTSKWEDELSLGKWFICRS